MPKYDVEVDRGAGTNESVKVSARNLRLILAMREMACAGETIDLLKDSWGAVELGPSGLDFRTEAGHRRNNIADINRALHSALGERLLRSTQGRNGVYSLSIPAEAIELDTKLGREIQHWDFWTWIRVLREALRETPPF